MIKFMGFHLPRGHKGTKNHEEGKQKNLLVPSSPRGFVVFNR